MHTNIVVRGLTSLLRVSGPVEVEGEAGHLAELPSGHLLYRGTAAVAGETGTQKGGEGLVGR